MLTHQSGSFIAEGACFGCERGWNAEGENRVDPSEIDETVWDETSHLGIDIGHVFVVLVFKARFECGWGRCFRIVEGRE